MPSLLSGTGLTCLVPHLCLFAARSAALPCVGSASALHHYTTRPSRVLTYSHPCSRTCAACKTKLLISVALEESASMTKLLISVALEESASMAGVRCRRRCCLLLRGGCIGCAKALADSSTR